MQTTFPSHAAWGETRYAAQQSASAASSAPRDCAKLDIERDIGELTSEQPPRRAASSAITAVADVLDTPTTHDSRLRAEDFAIVER